MAASEATRERGRGGSRWGARAVVAGAVALLGLALVVAWVPQRPDGDATALAAFDARYGAGPLHRLRDSLWLHGATALVAWGALARLLHSRRGWVALLWFGLLVAWGGWAWNGTRGWQGELFLEPGVATPLGADGTPSVTFECFLLPPAPDGPGRALRLLLRVGNESHVASEAHPYREGGWTLTPRWYGATVRAKSLAAPLFFGGDGTQHARLADGGSATITVDVETLAAQSEPPLPGLHATHHAILAARFAPGDPLLWLGGTLVALGGLGWLVSRPIMRYG